MPKRTVTALAEVDFVEMVKQMDNEEMRVLTLTARALKAGGEAKDRVKRGGKWICSPQALELSHSDCLKAIEAIATGNLNGLPDYLADSLKEVVSP